MATRYQAVLDKSLAVSTKKKDEDALEEVRILIPNFIKTIATATDCSNCKIDSSNSNMMIVMKKRNNTNNEDKNNDSDSKKSDKNGYNSFDKNKYVYIHI